MTLYADEAATVASAAGALGFRVSIRVSPSEYYTIYLVLLRPLLTMQVRHGIVPLNVLRWVGYTFVLLASVSAASSHAQEAQVTGLVLDAQTGQPLPGAHVFVSRTTLGDATAPDGRFDLVGLLPGPSTIVASMVGYETEAAEVRLDPGETRSLRFLLRPSTQALGEVVVAVDRDPEWRRDLRRFTELFLGETPNARRTTLLNPEVLDFDRLPSDGLAAQACAPLVMENRALGYRVTLHNLTFQGDVDTQRWGGQVAFEPLDPENARGQRRWDDARARAYSGSTPHFLAALVAGRAAAEGFDVRLVSRPGSNAIFRLTDGDLGGLLHPARESAPPGTRCLRFDGALSVVYTRERGRWRQQSWLTNPSGEVCLDAVGRELDPLSTTRYGYWTRERAAELLPLDYRPGVP